MSWRHQPIETSAAPSLSVAIRRVDVDGAVRCLGVRRRRI